MNRAQHRKLVWLALLAFPLFFSAKSPVYIDDLLAEKHLAIQLMPNWGEPITFAMVTVFEGKVVGKRPLNKEQFILIGSGKLKDPANPGQINLFEQHGISNCNSSFDEVMRQHRYQCDGVNTLWKLRYAEHPGDLGAGKGWARNPNGPDAGHLNQLKRFGIERLNDMIYGEQAYALLKAVADPSFVQSYQ